MNNTKITLYTTGCPRCKMLAQALDAAKVEYDICNDVDTIMKLGVKFVPVLEVPDPSGGLEDKLLDYGAAMTWVRSHGGAA